MSDVHPFNVGQFRCWVISDSQRQLDDPFQRPFVNASEDDMRAEGEAYIAASGDPATTFGKNILVVDTGTNRVVVDTGDGAGVGNLLSSFAETGLDPTDIDTVIITHGHGDHISACTDGNGIPSFPNARYVMSQTDWDHWIAEPRPAVTTHLLPIADRVERIANDAEIIPGIRAIPAPGHSPGQIALLLESDGEQLLHVADTWHFPVQVTRPEWYLSFDWDHERAIETRKSLRGLAARENLLVLPYHAAFPGLGHVVADGDAFRWQPLR